MIGDRIRRYWAVFRLITAKGLEYGHSVRLAGKPLLIVARGGKIRLGDHVVLNSRNKTYHANMACPVKLLSDREGALIDIGSRSRLHGCSVHAWKRVTIGQNCLIAAGVQIMDANGHELAPLDPADRLVLQDEPRPVRIGNNVWIGLNAIILPGSVIGDGAVIAAGSVVSGVVPPGVLVGGQPARMIRSLYPQTTGAVDADSSSNPAA